VSETTAGGRTAELFDAEGGSTMRLLALYPARDPERPRQFGPYTVDAAWDAPIEDSVFPLVVISHGSGGTHLGYRTLAAHLARRGFVVVLPEHPRNNRNDDSLAGTHTLLADRPRQLRLATDWAYADAALGPRLAPDAVAVVGHSLGGYTALAVAGGRPWAAPHETPDGRPRPVPVTPDPRVKALVLLAPATPWYLSPEGLRDVRVPILILSGEHDVQAPAWHAEVVRRGVPAETPVEHRVVPNAGHFSFLAPFPPAMVRPGFLPAEDPPGFDRARFHAELGPEIERFLRRVL
jgi:predicted dienelactone hydrolase